MLNNHAVAIVGGGPTGMMLAGELALSGIDVAIVERQETQQRVGMRAGGLHARSLEVLDQRGIVERFLACGQKAQVAGFAMIPLDISDFPTRHNYGLALWQSHIERLLAEWIAELSVPIYCGREVSDFAQDETGVDVGLSDGSSLRAQYLVGCDGGRSTIRKRAGIEFAGWDASMSCLLAEVELRDEPSWGMRRDAHGIHGLSKMEDGTRVRVMVTESVVGPREQPTLPDLSAALIAVYGTDYGVHSPSSIARFTDMARQAVCYRSRRVLLAGDAAHVHAPSGGQGLNLGVQDAVNLGWKLARVVEGAAPESLLDSYHAERHPVAARVLRMTQAMMALNRGTPGIDAVRETLSDLLQLEEPRKRYAGILSGLELRYDFGEGHPLLGRRMPDLEVETEGGTRRVFSWLHGGKPVLLDFGAAGALETGAWGDRVAHERVYYANAWELPVVGAVAAPTAVLVRPDGYVAWVGDGTAAGLPDALTMWFGPPARGGGARRSSSVA